MNRRLMEALENCIKAMDEGDSMETCLNKYPDLVPELHDLLKTVGLVECLRAEKIPNEIIIQSRLSYLHKAR